MKLFNWFRKAEKHPRQLRQEALDSLRNAEARGDTREMGQARARLRQATHDLMRAELRVVS